MRNFISIIMAAVFFTACAQQNIQAPVSSKSANIKKADIKKMKSADLSASNTNQSLPALKKPEITGMGTTGVLSSGGGFDTSSILSMVGSALLTGLISGLVSKALQ